MSILRSSSLNSKRARVANFETKRNYSNLIAKAIYYQNVQATEFVLNNYLTNEMLDYRKLSSSVYASMENYSVSENFSPVKVSNLTELDAKISIDNGSFTTISMGYDISGNSKVLNEIKRFCDRNSEKVINLSMNVNVIMPVTLPVIDDNNAGLEDGNLSNKSGSTFQSTLSLRKQKPEVEIVNISKTLTFMGEEIGMVDLKNFEKIKDEFSVKLSESINSKKLYYSMLVFSEILLKADEKDSEIILNENSDRARFFLAYNLIKSKVEFSTIENEEYYRCFLSTK